jgi:preprotein translocase subunit SecA
LVQYLVESNEHLSRLLQKEHLPHEVLNAKNHAREAEIIAKAGEKGSLRLQLIWLVVVQILN